MLKEPGRHSLVIADQPGLQFNNSGPVVKSTMLSNLQGYNHEALRDPVRLELKPGPSTH